MIGNSSPCLLFPSSLVFNTTLIRHILIGLTLYFFSINLPFTFSIALSFYTSLCIIPQIFSGLILCISILGILTCKDYIIHLKKIYAPLFQYSTILVSSFLITYTSCFTFQSSSTHLVYSIYQSSLWPQVLRHCSY